MNKIYVTSEQFEILKKAYESTLGTSDFTKYSCALSFKGKRGNWIHSLYTAPVFDKGYFKKIRGETYIYHIDGHERYCLSQECKELLIPTFL